MTATNKNLEPLIAAGLFREDLFYRINVVPIHLPPLRERSDDIEALARHFLILAAAEGLPRRQLSLDAVELLRRQPWRGNVRELRNVIYRVALLARDETIEPAALEPLLVPGPRGGGVGEGGEAGLVIGNGLDAAVTGWLVANDPPQGMVYDSALAAFERPLFAEVLRTTGGNQLRAAQMLGINRNTLRKRLVELALDPEVYHSRS